MEAIFLNCNQELSISYKEKEIPAKGFNKTWQKDNADIINADIINVDIINVDIINVDTISLSVI